MTSSTAAASPAEDAGPTDETVWAGASDKPTTEHARSKTLAERDAWQIAERMGAATSPTTILPGMILGPSRGASLVCAVMA